MANEPGVVSQIIGWVTRRRPSAPMENPNIPLSQAYDLMGEALGIQTSITGVTVNVKTALGYSPLWRGVNMIARDVGKLPLDVFRRVDIGKERAVEHPAYRLLKWKPNTLMTAMQFRMLLTGHAILLGNGYAVIDRDGAGVPVALLPLDPVKVTCGIVQGELWYEYTGPDVVGVRIPIPARDMLHIKGLSYDGLVGYSVIEKARESLGLGIGARDHAANFFRNSMRPSAVIEMPEGKSMSEEAVQRFQRRWSEAHSGIDNAHRVAILYDGTKLHPFSVTPEDGQLLETRQFEIREVANWLGVPPHKLGDTTRTAYASLEQENQSYLDDALDGWLVTWEQEMRDKLLSLREQETDTHVIEFNRSALVRADLKARADYYARALGGAPWMVPDEARAKENMNALPDGQGQQYFRPLNMSDKTGESDLEEPARQALLDVMRRMTKRLYTHARKSGTDHLLRDHEGLVRDALTPTVRLYAALYDMDPARLETDLVTALNAEVCEAFAQHAHESREAYIPQIVIERVIGDHDGTPVSE